MTDKSNHPFKFWEELKRRKVIRIIIVYAAAAYVILELTTMITEPLHLPDWTATLVILILIIGFPIVAILSWIFDITPEGLKKTEPTKVTKEETVKHGKRRLRISDLIIAILVVIVIILAYPRVFKSNASLRTMTYPVTVVNEFGKKETRRVFKEGHVTRLAIFPFMNESNDSSIDWLQHGLYDAIWEDLQQFNYISILGDDHVFYHNEQIKIAKSNNYPHFLTGGFRINDGIYEITSRLYQTTNGSVKAERTFKGSDLLFLIDSISLQARIDLGIPDNLLNSAPDLPIKELLTENLDAFHFFIKGYYYRDSIDYYYFKAVELDSTFAFMSLIRALDYYNFQDSHESAVKDIKQAMRHRHRMSEHRAIRTLILYHSILGNIDKAIELAETQHDLQPYNIRILIELIETYGRNSIIHNIEKALEQLNKLVPNVPQYKLGLARSYLHTGKLDKGLKVLEKLLKDNPENTKALMQMGEIFLHKNDLKAAEKVFEQATLFNPEDEKQWSKILDHIDYIRDNPSSQISLESLTGNYRFDDIEMNILFSIHNNHLYTKSENQWASFRYPVSDNRFVSYNGYTTYTFITNNQDKVIKFIFEQINYPGITNLLWKEDSLILTAKNLLNNGNMSEALSTFHQAYEKNPEHYYLGNFIQHLEFIQSLKYDEWLPVLESYLGKYAEITVYWKNDQFYYIDLQGLIYKLLPISEVQFMAPSFYNRQIQIVKENDSVTGIKFIYRDGREEFFERTSEQVLARENSN